MITNDAIILGILLSILATVFWTSSRPDGFWRRFHTFFPALLLCYFVPSLLGTTGVVAVDSSRIYFVASRYLLPTSLVLLTLSIDLQSILRLGPKALALFLTGTFGVFVGGPLALGLVGALFPAGVGGNGEEAIWRGLTTIAGDWIGGGANQTAMKEVFGVGNDLFAALVTVDIIVASVWLALLLFAAGRAESIDARLGANTSALTAVRERIAQMQGRRARIPRLTDTMLILAVGFGATALAHLLASGPGGEGSESFPDGLAGWIGRTLPALARLNLTSPFFWVVLLATSFGLLLSFTPARRLESAGASRIGTALLYVLVASIGMGMNLKGIFLYPWLVLVVAVWITIHAALLILVARLIRAPLFFIAVGSQANIGGAASAPVVASAFHPSLAPVGVLLAVLGYALGTYAAWGCGQLMRLVSEFIGLPGA